MKVVVAWLFLIVLALALAGSCSIKHSSEQFECETNTDCAGFEDDRVCAEGLCVVPGGPNPNKDASTDGRPGDAANACPSQCTSCNVEKRECLVECDKSPTLCANQLTCPTGYTCLYKCNTPSSCRNGISCLTAEGCNVECSGSMSCRNIVCGPGPCNVTCAGQSSCSGVSCGSSCACDVKCGSNALCFNVQCTKPMCDIGAGCSTQPAGCNTCM